MKPSHVALVAMFGVMVCPAQAAATSPPRVFSVAGSGSSTLSGDGLPATDAGGEFREVATLPDGGFLVSGGVVRRIEADGAITTVAGNGSFSFQEPLGDGAPATSANLDPEGLAVLPGDGFLVADTAHHRVRLVNSRGIISTVAGSGSPAPLFPPLTGPAPALGDGGPATSASLDYPTDVAALPGGGYLIADVGDNRVRMVDTHGIITTVAGTGTAGFSGDGGPATRAALDGPAAVAVLPRDGFLIAERQGNRVRQVDAHGVITTVAGTGRQGTSGDGRRATRAALTSPGGVAPLPGGGFLIAEGDRVRRVDSHAIISTVAGAPRSVRSGNVEFAVEPAHAQWSGLSDGLGGPAPSAQIAPLALAAEPDGSILVGAYTHVLVLATGKHPLPAVAIRPPTIINGVINVNVVATEPGRERIVVQLARDGRQIAAFTKSVGTKVSSFRLPRTPGGTLIVRVTLNSHGRLATDETAIVSGHVLPLELARTAIAYRCCGGKPPVVPTTRARRAQEAEETPPSLVSCRRFSATRVDCQWGWQHRCTEAASAVLRNALVYLTVYVPCTYARHPRHHGAPWIAPLM